MAETKKKTTSSKSTAASKAKKTVKKSDSEKTQTVSDIQFTAKATKKIRTGLGKGLDLLIPTVPEEEKSSNEPLMLKLSMVEPNRDQPRKQFDKESLEDLAGSIKEYGIIQPIIVSKKDDYYQIIAGERRWRAAKLAGLKEIPAIIKEYTDKEIAEISLIENIQRENLNPIEEAQAYKSLIDEYNLTQEELSDRVSKSRVYITNTMRLLKLDPEVQGMLAQGQISSGHARALLSLDDPQEQINIAQQIIGDNLSVRQTEDLVRRLKEPVKIVERMPRIKNSVFYKDLERRMAQNLNTKVKIIQKEPGKGKIEINFYSEDELDTIFTMINGNMNP